MANALIKKTGIYFVGNVAAQVTSALIVPIYAFFVTSENLGRYDYFITLAQMISPLCFLAIWESVLRYVMRETDESKRGVLISSIIAFSIAATSVIILGSFILSNLMSAISQSVIAVAVMSASVGLAQVWQYFARSLGHTKLYAASGIISAFVSFGGVILFVCLLRQQLTGLVSAYILSQLSLVVIIEFKLRLISSFSLKSISKHYILKLLRFSAPLALNLLLLAFVTGFGRILITNVLGPADNGLYTFAMKFGTILVSLGSIFAMAVVEEAILRIGKPDADQFFQIVTTNTLYLLLCISSILMPCIEIFYYLIASTEYASSLVYTPAFIGYGIATVLSTVVACVFQTTQKTQYVALTSAVGAIATAVFSILAVRPFGAQGVALGLFLGALAMLLTRYFISKRLVSYSLATVKGFVLLALLIASSSFVFSGLIASNIIAQAVWLAGALAVFTPLALKSFNVLRRIPDSKDV